MPNILVFDTETSSLPLWSQPSESPEQPHIVQLAAYLMDANTGQEVDRCVRYVKPDGWGIHSEALGAHGITEDFARRHGIAEADVVQNFMDMVQHAAVISAFNVDFDLRILRIALLRQGYPKTELDGWAATINKYCVMRASTPFAKAPPTDKMMATGRKAFKQPSLSEAVEAIFKVKMQGAHRANVDVRWTIKLHFWLNKLPEPKFNPDPPDEAVPGEEP